MPARLFPVKEGGRFEICTRSVIKSAPLPLDETQRLATLQMYGVLDTAQDQALHDLALLAAQICETPIAFVALLDERRQWFAAKVGFDAPETPRDVSFCAHALVERDLLIVPDARRDERFAKNPTVTGEPRIRFYASAPLIAPEGAILGALCVVDRKPRALTAACAQALRVLSGQVMARLELRRQTTVLIASEARNRTFFEYAPDGILIANTGSTYLDANPSMCRMLGYARDELIGLHASDIVAPEEIPQIESALEVIKASADYHREWRFRRKDGSQFPAEVIATQMPDGSLLAMVRDITERKQAEVASRRLAAIVESSDDAIIGKDLNGIVTSWNAGAETTYGYTSIEMIGSSIMRLIPADRQDEERQILEQLRRGKRV